MTPQFWNWVLGIGFVLCLAVLISMIIYFQRQWDKLESMLEEAEKSLYNEESQELQETRESKLFGQVCRILNNARYKERRAVGEKNQVMELISDLSHQLKTPLANIVMNMEILKDSAMEEGQKKEFLEHTAGQAAKMQWLMENLLKASRLENGMIDFQADDTLIKGTIAKAVSAVYAQASMKQIQIRVEEFQDFFLYHNPKWTAEALTNVLENAIKYSPQGSCVWIRISRLDIYTRIMVEDEGIGIPEKEYNCIFQRFYRGKAVEQEEGSGLGLYLAQLILQCEKGYITVNSRPGQGSIFSLFLLNNR